METHSLLLLVMAKLFLSYLGSGLRHCRSILSFMLHMAS